ncbi:MAG: filamentous hemagglutinin N-terminal domain-containing protein [Tolypothrix brevis GSE-NOS-MK-07-07A]|jgi:filamentous hemagglutinin family protein|nr:filamentous hemagglutinin N-terminal domain-containing protein [Tolypothrix brevis GSE-NOS-MK-07-07A]
MTQDCKKLALGFIFALGGATCSINSAFAQQITIDGTLSPGRTLSGPNYIIPQADGQTVGNNLFQSFGRFNLNAGESANFQSDVNIRNILSRVTGGFSSTIDGRIFTQSANVNLFFINPSGIIFGPNAVINVGSATRGSFIATTADALVWANGGQFSATNPSGASPLLTIVGDPSGFLSSLRPPQPIASSGNNLTVFDGQSLLLLGGNLTFDNSNLQTPGGRVELAGIAGTGTVGLEANGNIFSLNIPDNLARADVSLQNRSSIDVTAANQGNIAIVGRNVDFIGGSQLRTGIGSGLGAVNSQAGDITVNATGRVTINQSSRLSNTVATRATGNAGNISIKAGEILINNQGSDAAISTNRSVQGRGGNVLLESSGSIFVTGESLNSVESVISTFAGQASTDSGDISLNASGAIKLDNAFFVTSRIGGNGGNISLQGNEISLANNSSLVSQAFSRGNSGSITLNSTGPISIQNTLVNTAVGNQDSNTPNPQVGNAGNINISGRSVSLTGGSEISSRSFTGVNSGNINVNATEFVSISGNAPRIPRPRSDRASNFTNTILTTTAGRNSRGNAGNISIKAGEIFINNQANNPAVSTTSQGLGRGGNVSLQASGSISLIGRDRQANDLVISTSGERNSLGSGDISLNANGSISLDNAFLRASTNGGDAGSILVRGNERVSFANNSALTTEALLGRGNAGPITVESFGPISLQNSLIATNVGSPSDRISRPELGNAGNIKIEGRSVALTAGSEISSRSFSGVNSGNIEVNGTQFVDISGRASQFPRRGSDRANSFPYTTLATTSEQLARGVSGDITVNTNNLRISDGASVRADTRSNFSGGSVNINANVVDITNGGQIFTTAFSSGNAGDILLNVSDRLNISGSNPGKADIFNQIAQNSDRTQAEFQLGSPNSEAGIFANTSLNSTAQGGDLTINTPLLRVQDGATISVSSPQGQAGNLNITAKTILLNQGSLTAKTGITPTQEGQSGANIQLKDVDLLLLQNNSFISAQARDTATGGNITIDAKKGFVIAPLGENSDIIASASVDRGGNITINTQGIFGFFEGRATPGNGTNDIDVSSDFNDPGTVDINTLDIDPRRGLLELPASVVEVSRLIASNCGGLAGKDGSSFTYTGRSGLPDSPDDFLSSDVVWSDTRLTNIPSEVMYNAPTSKPFNQTKDGIAIVPAIGWIFNNKGEVTLIASQSETPSRIYSPTTCQNETD